MTRFAVADEVYGVSRGSYAEYAVAHEDKLARKPANVSFEQAAVVPVSGLVAQRGLVDVGQLQAGQKVLITGASGGVGGRRPARQSPRRRELRPRRAPARPSDRTRSALLALLTAVTSAPRALASCTA